ncbi:MAG: hypothetical protein U0136_16240 [Bdellovibrionota bacterium]
MSIRLQSLMAILPIFVAVGVLSGYLRYSSELEELAWGLRSEAEGYAIALESALHGETLKHFMQHDSSAVADAESKIDKVISGKRIRRVAAVSPDGADVYFERKSSDLSDKMVLSAEALKSLDQLSIWISELERTEGAAYLQAYMPLRDDSGQLLGALVVETDATEYITREETSFREVLQESGGVILLGALCALIIAQVLRRRIRELSRLAAEIGEGRQASVDDAGAIQELRDLKDSLQTMSSIMQDILVRAKHGLLEKEQFRTQQELFDVYGEECLDVRCRELGAMQFVACRNSESGGGDFVEMFEAENKICAVFGRIAAQDFVVSTRESSAAGVYSAEQVRRKGPEAAWEHIRGCFAVEAWSCVTYTEYAPYVELWQLSSDGTTLNYQMHPVGRGHLLFQSRHGRASDQMSQYADVFRDVPPYELKAELASLTKGSEHGAIVIVGGA